jgi:hypothetical protein
MAASVCTRKLTASPANHQRHTREAESGARHFHAMPWEGRFIWGATAGMLKNLHARLYCD